MLRQRKTRRRLSMTSLIDVIFLLLLFFMLSSTFSKFSEVELSAASGGAAITADTSPLFLQLHPDRLSLNGQDVPLNALEAALRAQTETVDPLMPTPLLISLKGGVTAQRLTDLLVALRGVTTVTPTVLGDA